MPSLPKFKPSFRLPRGFKRLKCNPGNYQCGMRCQSERFKCPKQSAGVPKTALEWAKFVTEQKERVANINQRRPGAKSMLVSDDQGFVSRVSKTGAQSQSAPVAPPSEKPAPSKRKKPAPPKSVEPGASVTPTGKKVAQKPTEQAEAGAGSKSAPGYEQFRAELEELQSIQQKYRSAYNKGEGLFSDHSPMGIEYNKVMKPIQKKWGLDPGADDFVKQDDLVLIPLGDEYVPAAVTYVQRGLGGYGKYRGDGGRAFGKPSEPTGKIIVSPILGKKRSELDPSVGTILQEPEKAIASSSALRFDITDEDLSAANAARSQYLQKYRESNKESDEIEKQGIALYEKLKAKGVSLSGRFDDWLDDLTPFLAPSSAVKTAKTPAPKTAKAPKPKTEYTALSTERQSAVKSGDLVFFNPQKNSKTPRGAKVLGVDAKGMAQLEYTTVAGDKKVAVRPVSSLLAPKDSVAPTVSTPAPTIEAKTGNDKPVPTQTAATGPAPYEMTSAEYARKNYQKAVDKVIKMLQEDIKGKSGVTRDYRAMVNQDIAALKAVDSYESAAKVVKDLGYDEIDRLAQVEQIREIKRNPNTPEDIKAALENNENLDKLILARRRPQADPSPTIDPQTGAKLSAKQPQPAPTPSAASSGAGKQSKLVPMKQLIAEMDDSTLAKEWAALGVNSSNNYRDNGVTVDDILRTAKSIQEGDRAKYGASNSDAAAVTEAVALHLREYDRDLLPIDQIRLSSKNFTPRQKEILGYLSAAPSGAGKQSKAPTSTAAPELSQDDLLNAIKGAIKTGKSLSDAEFAALKSLSDRELLDNYQSVLSQKREQGTLTGGQKKDLARIEAPEPAPNEDVKPKSRKAGPSISFPVSEALLSARQKKAAPTDEWVSPYDKDIQLAITGAGKLPKQFIGQIVEGVMSDQSSQDGKKTYYDRLMDWSKKNQQGESAIAIYNTASKMLGDIRIKRFLSPSEESKFNAYGAVKQNLTNAQAAYDRANSADKVASRKHYDGGDGIDEWTSAKLGAAKSEWDEVSADYERLVRLNDDRKKQAQVYFDDVVSQLKKAARPAPQPAPTPSAAPTAQQAKPEAPEQTRTVDPNGKKLTQKQGGTAPKSDPVEPLRELSKIRVDDSQSGEKPDNWQDKTLTPERRIELAKAFIEDGRKEIDAINDEWTQLSNELRTLEDQRAKGKEKVEINRRYKAPWETRIVGTGLSNVTMDEDGKLVPKKIKRQRATSKQIAKIDDRINELYTTASGYRDAIDQIRSETGRATQFIEDGGKDPRPAPKNELDEGILLGYERISDDVGERYGDGTNAGRHVEYRVRRLTDEQARKYGSSSNIALERRYYDDSTTGHYGFQGEWQPMHFDITFDTLLESQKSTLKSLTSDRPEVQKLQQKMKDDERRRSDEESAEKARKAEAVRLKEANYKDWMENHVAKQYANGLPGKKATITIGTSNPTGKWEKGEDGRESPQIEKSTTSIPATIYGNLAVHKTYGAGGYSISDPATGLRIGNPLPTIEKARQLAAVLYHEVSAAPATEWTASEREKAKDIMESFAKEQRPSYITDDSEPTIREKPKKSRKEKPQSFSERRTVSPDYRRRREERQSRIATMKQRQREYRRRLGIE